MKDKPPKNSGYCDRCGTDLIRKKSDEKQSVKYQCERWRTLFWKLQIKAKEQNIYKIYSVDKFENNQELLTKMDRDYRSCIEKQKCYWDIIQDSKG